MLNSANEAALRLFQERKIGFTQIHGVCAEAVAGFTNEAEPSLESIIHANSEVYRRIIRSY